MSKTEPPTEEETKRYYGAFMSWYGTFYPSEAFMAQVGVSIDQERFAKRIEEWAKDITNKEET